MSPRALTLGGYALLAALALAWELVCRRTGRTDLWRVLRILARRPTGRLVLLVFWAWLGWHLFVRGTVAG